MLFSNSSAALISFFFLPYSVTNSLTHSFIPRETVRIVSVKSQRSRSLPPHTLNPARPHLSPQTIAPPQPVPPLPHALPPIPPPPSHLYSGQIGATAAALDCRHSAVVASAIGPPSSHPSLIPSHPPSLPSRRRRSPPRRPALRRHSSRSPPVLLRVALDLSSTFSVPPPISVAESTSHAWPVSSTPPSISADRCCSPSEAPPPPRADQRVAVPDTSSSTATPSPQALPPLPPSPPRRHRQTLKKICLIWKKNGIVFPEFGCAYEVASTKKPEMEDTSVTDSLARTRVTWSDDDTLILYQYCVEEVEASGELSEESYRLIQQKMCDQRATYGVKNIKQKIINTRKLWAKMRSRDSQDYNLRCRHHLDLLDRLFDQAGRAQSSKDGTTQSDAEIKTCNQVDEVESAAPESKWEKVSLRFAIPV
uniref:Myb/SANT-like domain-containing protein n=1 Tax=Oryza rufipogon TaxID=4529 RepID=A0A0E0QMK5_ORYRU